MKSYLNNRYFNNSFWVLTERSFRMGINLIIGIYLIRYLGPEKFGMLSFAQSFVGLFTILTILGLDSIIVREIVKSPNDFNLLLGTAFWLKLIGAIIAFFAIVVLLQFTNSTKEESILVYIIAVSLIFQSFNVINLYFQSKVLSKYVVQVQIIESLLSSIIKLFLIWIGAALTWFAFVFIIDALVLASGLILNYRRIEGCIRWKYRFDIAKNLLRDAWPLILAGIAVTIYMKIDQVMIREMLDAKSVGQYAAAVRISEALYFIPVAISSSVFPAIVNARNYSSELYNARLQKLYNLMVIIAVLIALPVMLIADELVITLFGADYLQSGTVLAVHVWAGVFVFIGVVNASSLVAENQQIQSMIRMVIGALINVLLNLVMIPIYGITGAAIATIISQVFSSYLSIPLFKGQWFNFVMVTKSLSIIGMLGKTKKVTS